MEMSSEQAELSVDSNPCEEENNDVQLMTDQIIEAVDELSLDVADIQKATEESLCLDDSGRRSIAAFASTAEHIKEIIHQTLKCRQDQPIDSEVLCPGEAGIREKIADLEKVIQDNKQEEAKESHNLSEDAKTDLPVNAQDLTILNKDIKAEDDPADLKQLQEPVITNLDEAIPASHSVITPEVTPDSIEDTCKTNNSTVTSKPATTLSSEEKVPKSSQKHKKGERTADQVLKSLSQCQSTDDKLRLLCTKHAEALEELRSLESRLRQGERQMLQLSREKEHLQVEHNRSVLARSRLESLCRELQRQNKMIKDESLLRIREEEEKRKEISAKFQGTLTDITTLLQENKKRDSQLREENLQLADKLKALVEHYDTWEKHMEKVLQQKELESQLSKAKLGKSLLQQQGEREQNLLEKQQLLENMTAMQKKGAQLAKTELQLRTELALYTAKYEEFQGVVAKSNQVFANFKVDMEKMAKKIKILEKETIQWKAKWENSNRALIEMAADKQKRDQELLVRDQRIATLEKLCRALQAERNNLQNMCKSDTTVAHTETTVAHTETAVAHTETTNNSVVPEQVAINGNIEE